MYILHVVTGRSQVWVGTGSGIVPVIIDQVVTCVCMVSRPSWMRGLITNLKQQIQHNTTHQKSERKENINNTKSATFTYYSPKVRKITNPFKQTDIKVAFKNNNIISQIFRRKATNNTPIYNKTRLYKLTCKTCQKFKWDKPVET